MGSELLQDVLDMIAHGDGADTEMVGNGARRHAFFQASQDFLLSWAQELGSRRAPFGRRGGCVVRRRRCTTHGRIQDASESLDFGLVGDVMKEMNHIAVALSSRQAERTDAEPNRSSGGGCGLNLKMLNGFSSYQRGQYRARRRAERLSVRSYSTQHVVACPPDDLACSESQQPLGSFVPEDYLSLGIRQNGTFCCLGQHGYDGLHRCSPPSNIVLFQKRRFQSPANLTGDLESVWCQGSEPEVESTV